jgi:hypothetical protein
MYVTVLKLYALECTVEKLKVWYCSVRLNVQGLFKCSCVAGERSKVSGRLSGKCSKVVLKMALDRQAHR